MASTVSAFYQGTFNRTCSETGNISTVYHTGKKLFFYRVSPRQEISYISSFELLAEL
jgi:hypothetical protein